MPEDGSLLQKHVGEFICMNALWFYTNHVHLLVYVGDTLGSHIISCAKDYIATCNFFV
jgi:hypothetical protein